MRRSGALWRGIIFIIIVGLIGIKSIGKNFALVGPPKINGTYTPSLPHTTPSYPNNFFDARYFVPSSYSTYGEVLHPEKESGDIVGVVVPHHLLAHELIGEVFEHLKAAPPSEVVVIGPNHYHRGNRILTSSWGWQTPFGVVEANQEGVKSLLTLPSVREEPDVFTEEHSIGGLMPFIKYYLPKAKVLPVILHHDVSQEEAKELANHLLIRVEKGAILIASVDFSHYLPLDEAREKDRETLEVFRSKNYGRLFSLGNDHLDSPASMGILLYAMAELDLGDFTLLQNTNSGVILGNELIETTSYMTMVFQRKKP